jgi:AraC family transcriptional regulator
MIPSSLRFDAALQAFAVVLPLLFLCASTLAQGSPGHDAKTVLARIAEARGTPSQPVTSLSIEGTFDVLFDGLNDGKPCMQGKFRDVFSGEKLMRHTSDMGEHGAIDKGATEDFVWEIDPLMGARILDESEAALARRHAAAMRGVRPETLYRDIAVTGTKAIDGREHVVLRMTPEAGKPDTWYVDQKTWLVVRVDMTVPAPASANAVWGLGDEIESQLTFADWKRIDGVQYPQRRSLRLGTITFASTLTKIEPNAPIDASRFVPPESVTKAKAKAATRPPRSASRPAYEVEDREPQAVASIRVKCREEDIGKTLALVFPEIMGHLNAEGAKIAGVPFSRYHGVAGAELDLEAGLPINKPIAETGRIKNSVLPGGRAVVTWHIGPYEKLKPAHEALKSYLDANALKSRGGPWELYWTDPGVVPDPAKWRTQLVMPIE